MKNIWFYQKPRSWCVILAAVMLFALLGSCSAGGTREHASTESTPITVTSSTVQTDSTRQNYSYVGSIKSDKYHYTYCRCAKNILPENEIWFGSAEQAENAGYSPCAVCNP